MRRYHYGLIALALLAVASCASAAVITVTPSNLQGWGAVAANGGTGQFASFGPAVDEGSGFSLGNGAWYATCGYEGDDGIHTPSSVWFGTDKIGSVSLQGLPISAVTGLSYQAYISSQPTINDPNGPKWAMQPITLQFALTKADGVNRRYVMHRAFGIRGQNTGGSLVGQWLRFNAYTCDSPLDEWLEVTTTTEYQSFSAIPQTYKFALTSTWWNASTARVYDVPQVGYKSAGWDLGTTPPGDPTSTGTGFSMNFEVGARKSVVNAFGDPAFGWYRESVGFKGYMDDFKITVNGTEYDYDFESDAPPAQVVALNNRAAYDAICYGAKAQTKFRFKVFGIVLADPAPSSDGFWLDDGSAKPIHVLATNAGAVAGQYWSAVGRLYTPFSGTNKELYSNSSDCYQLE